MKVKVNPRVMKSLIEQYHIPRDILADKIKINDDELALWESIETEINISTLKKIAKQWNCHWSIFLTQKPPKSLKKPKSFRKANNTDSSLNAETILAYQNANRILTLSSDLDGRKIDTDTLSNIGKLSSTNPEELARKFRGLIKLDSAHNKADVAELKFWTERVEDLGIYVSQQVMPTQEVRAFLALEKDRAVIVINRKEEFKQAKIFSLLHEIGHMLDGESASCDLYESFSNKYKVNQKEVLCNRFAGAVLLPSNMIEAEELNTGDATTDEAIKDLSKKFRVSYSVTLRRLVICGIISETEYGKRIKKFERDVLPEIRAKAAVDNKEFVPGPNFHPSRWVTSSSPAFAREVFDSYLSNHISYGEVSKYLGVSVNHIPKIQQYLGYD